MKPSGYIDRRQHDPTPATQDLVLRTAQAERDYTDGQIGRVEARLAGIDTATRLLAETITRVPTTLQSEIAHVKSLVDERFSSVGTQFAERDERVALILATNEKAIDKSDSETRQTISKLQDLFETKVDALSKQLDDLQGRIDRGEGRDTGKSDSGAGVRLNVATAAQAVATLVAIIALVVVGFHK
jgi:hypothetical protein